MGILVLDNVAGLGVYEVLFPAGRSPSPSFGRWHISRFEQRASRFSIASTRMKYSAQLAQLVSKPPSGAAWIHELKLDGYRIAVAKEGASVELISRRGTKWTADFPELAASAKKLPAGSALIDGEIAVLSASGVSSFEALQNRGRERGSLAYFAFDLLSLDGRDLRRLPLLERKDALRMLLGDGIGIMRYTEHFDEPGDLVLRRACELGAEGIVSKRADAPYRSGVRSPDWQKSKCSRRQEFVVGGFTDPSGSRVGVGSLLVGYYEGDALRFAGKVGTGRGWTAAFGRDLRARLERSVQKISPFDPHPSGWLGRNAHWVTPNYVVEVGFTEWTSGGHIRHPSLQGFRTDKLPTEVVRESAAEANAETPAVAASLRVKNRRVYPRAGVDLATFLTVYRDIADQVMPHVARRPLTVVRCNGPIVNEDALRSQCVFVRHTARDNAWAPKSVPRIRIQEKRKVGEYLYVETIEQLLLLIEHGVVEWHVWNARVDDVENPDQLVFDLDPGEGTKWTQVVAAAKRVRKALSTMKLDCWPKTTGGRGLHVVAPIERGRSWDDAFAFSRAVAEAIAGAEPELYTAAFGKSERRGKVLIDYKRNYRTSIAVAAFSPRARPNATVSVPIDWNQVTARLKPDRFTVRSIAK